MITLLGHIGTFFDQFYVPTSNPFLSFKCHIIPLKAPKVKNMTKIYQENIYKSLNMKSLENRVVVSPREFLKFTNKGIYQIYT